MTYNLITDDIIDEMLDDIMGIKLDSYFKYYDETS